MSRNGSGTYQLPAGNPVVPSTVISSTWANNTLSDIGTALTQSIANDGQTTPVANLPMATFRHTNVGNAVARNDYAAAGQVQDSSLQWLTSVAGTNTITASVTPSPTAYVAGQTFRFVAAGANTGAVTLNINGLGAKSITKNGTAALGAGDIASSAVVEVTYDGAQFQLAAGAGSGAYLGVQVFSASGTYTPTDGTKSVVVEAIGGGGGSGGVAAQAAGNGALSVAGGAAAFARARFTSAFSGVTVTIGAAGAAGASGANAGGNGGATSFGALLSCPGGNGGAGGGGGAGLSIIRGALSSANPTVTGGTDMGSFAGNPGGTGVAAAAGAGGVGGQGGSSPWGSGGIGSTGGGGIAGGGFGMGGGAAYAGSGQGPFAGAAGGTGLVVVHEYS